MVGIYDWKGVAGRRWLDRGGWKRFDYDVFREWLEQMIEIQQFEGDGWNGAVKELVASYELDGRDDWKGVIGRIGQNAAVGRRQLIGVDVRCWKR